MRIIRANLCNFPAVVKSNGRDSDRARTLRCSMVPGALYCPPHFDFLPWRIR